MKKRLIFSIIALNYWPFLFTLASILVSIEAFPDVGKRLLCFFAFTYLVPPLLCRIVVAIFGKPRSSNTVGDRGYWVWWFTAQCQSVFLRFSALEEVLRMVPGLYSNWLRLWGAEIGKLVYWGPGIKIMDRPFIRVEDNAVIGFGAHFSSHGYFLPPLETKSGTPSLQFGIPTVRKRAIVGGITGLSPGSEVAEDELLPASMLLAPFYIWKDGRRHARQNSPIDLG